MSAYQRSICFLGFSLAEWRTFLLVNGVKKLCGLINKELGNNDAKRPFDVFYQIFSQCHDFAYQVQVEAESRIESYGNCPWI